MLNEDTIEATPPVAELSTPAETAPPDARPTDTITEEIPAFLLKRVLAPYHKDAIYVKRQWIDSDGANPAVIGGGLRGRAELSIPKSCYIADTGHFNAVEFNICFNQIGFLYAAHCVIRGVLPQLQVDFLLYERLKMPGMLILELRSRFGRAIDPSHFHGELYLTRMEEKPTFWMFDCAVRYWDESGGEADGEVTIAFLKASQIHKGTAKRQTR